MRLATHHAGEPLIAESSDKLPNGVSMMRLTARGVRSPRHTTQYWEAGPVDGPLMIFLHGWPGIGLMWRAQTEAFASEGWRCISPDMRGYGGCSAPTASNAYAL
jgi:pimeloyl-ACP methyl ester carboxylesterase